MLDPVGLALTYSWQQLKHSVLKRKPTPTLVSETRTGAHAATHIIMRVHKVTADRR